MTNGQRAGADAWIAGTYDPKLRPHLLGHRPGQVGRNGIGDKLFSNSTIALDVDTGTLKWYNQSAPDEGLDLDEVYEKVLVDEGPQKLLLTAGKKAFYGSLTAPTASSWIMSRWFSRMSLPALIARPAAAPTARISCIPSPATRVRHARPSRAGHNWPAASYIPEEDLIIFPLDQICVTLARRHDRQL